MNRALRVWDLGPLRGDAGPCDSVDCPERATRKVQIGVDSVQTTAFVCDTHWSEVMGKKLEPIPA